MYVYKNMDLCKPMHRDLFYVVPSKSAALRVHCTSKALSKHEDG